MSDLAAYIAATQALKRVTAEQFTVALKDRAALHWPAFHASPAGWLAAIHKERPDWTAAVWQIARPPEFSE